MLSLLVRLLVCSVLLAGASRGRAASLFTFSYEFASGRILSGSLNGDLQPDGTIRNLSNLSAVYSGQPGTPLTAIGFPSGAYFSLTGGFVFSGFESPLSYFGPMFPPTPTFDFGFSMDAVTPATNAVTVGTFSVTFGPAIMFPTGADALEAEFFARERFTAAEVTSGMPEPSSMIVLAAVFAAAAFARRRRLRRA